MITFDLGGRRALVTGAGRGVGRAIARGLAEAGADVVINDLDAGRARAVAEEIVRAGGSARPAAFDVTDHAAVHAAVEAVGRVDVLVNNAGNAGAEGFGRRAPFVDTCPEEWEPFLQVNLYGAMHCAHAALPGMIAAGWGRILTIVSDAGRTGDPGGAAYSAAKAGAAGLTRALARENARYGITANNISLGTMRTDPTEPLWSDPDGDLARTILRDYVVRRPGDPDEVAPLVVYLASDHASWITGQTYALNGGFSFTL
jgi:NAD(P)-dependent dehydrogenase (short-subunit alcohol dehydrogenase family)